jgi:glycosyltransferase involved in cell wall biosynthesis
MRVLMLAQFYAPVIGGEESVVQHTAKELVRRGHEVAVATVWHQGLPMFELDGGVRVHRLRASVSRFGWIFAEGERRHVPPAPDPELVLGLRRVLKQERPEVVHAHNWLVHSYLPLKSAGTGLVMTLHDYSLVCSKKRFFYRGYPCAGPGFTKCLSCAGAHYGFGKGITMTMLNWISSPVERRLVDIFLPVSRAVAVGTGLVDSAVPYEVVPNFIPDDLAERSNPPDDRVRELPPDGYVLFVGDIVEDKGIEILLRAHADVADAPPLVLIGRGQLAPGWANENVFVLGPWEPALVMEAWKRCSIAVVPSIQPEAFGLAALEAMSVGRPVIASRIGGLPDIVIDGETGLLVPPGDSLALKDGLQRLLGERALRERMGQEAARHASAFHASSVLPRLERIYARVASR